MSNDSSILTHLFDRKWNAKSRTHLPAAPLKEKSFHEVDPQMKVTILSCCQIDFPGAQRELVGHLRVSFNPADNDRRARVEVMSRIWEPVSDESDVIWTGFVIGSQKESLRVAYNIQLLGRGNC